MYVALVDGTESVEQTLDPARHTYVHVARGEVEVNGEKLGAGDAAMLSAEMRLTLRAGNKAEVLTFDLP
jgi:redox-sensitive bicupin YhaK (pirin superfamily)